MAIQLQPGEVRRRPEHPATAPPTEKVAKRCRESPKTLEVSQPIMRKAKRPCSQSKSPHESYSQSHGKLVGAHKQSQGGLGDYIQSQERSVGPIFNRTGESLCPAANHTNGSALPTANQIQQLTCPWPRIFQLLEVSKNFQIVLIFLKEERTVNLFFFFIGD